MTKARKRQVSEGEDEVTSPIAKKAKVKTPNKPAASKPAPVPAKNTDAEGNPYWELGNKRRVNTSTFKNTLLINIREYFEANGELKPGRKGISITVDQYRALLQVIPQLNENLRKAGHEIADPIASPTASTDGGAALTASSPPLAAAAASKKTSKREKTRKANIDVTSDEDDEE